MRMPTEHTEGLHQPLDPEQPEPGRFLLLARLAWVVLVGLSLLIFLGSLPAYLTQLQTICPGTNCQDLQLNPAGVQLLHQFDISPALYADVNLAFDLIWALAWFVLGVLIAWRKSNERWTLLVSFWMILQGTTTVSLIAGESTSLWHSPALISNTFAFVFLWLVFFLFPDGRFRPRWTRLAFGGLLVSALCYLLWPENALLQVLFSFSGVFCIIVAQIYRYWRISGPRERQQTKWVVYSITCVTFADLAVMLPNFVGAAHSEEFRFLYSLLAGFLVTVFTFFIPIAFAIALLRYRLWDIDTLINRTLVYGGLSGILAALYAGLIIGLEALAGAITGGQTTNQPLVLVVSTLVIAALFQPVHKGIQSVIDRRFYRKKYDAEKTLAAFSATLRHEVDLEQIREQLLAVVQETMQPEHVSLWLRQPERHHTEQAHPLESHSQVPTRPSPD